MSNPFSFRGNTWGNRNDVFIWYYPPLVEEGLSYGGYGLHLKPAIFAILITSGIGAI